MSENNITVNPDRNGLVVTSEYVVESQTVFEAVRRHLVNGVYLAHKDDNHHTTVRVFSKEGFVQNGGIL